MEDNSFDADIERHSMEKNTKHKNNILDPEIERIKRIESSSDGNDKKSSLSENEESKERGKQDPPVIEEVKADEDMNESEGEEGQEPQQISLTTCVKTEEADKEVEK
jgi:hypothetical protein